MEACTTHHHACDCREAKIQKLLQALEFYYQGNEWDYGVKAREVLQGWRGEKCMK